MSRKNRYITNHHILPKHLYPEARNNKNNITRLRNTIHEALHTLLDTNNGQAQAPREQIQKLVWILSSALTDEFKNDINKILTIDDKLYYYKKDIIV